MNKHSCDYLVIIHRLFIDDKPKKGGVDIILDYLSNNGAKICLVEHSLESKGGSIFRTGGAVKRVNIFPNIMPFRRLMEVLVTAVFVLRSFEFIPCCIAVDPLNVLPALILKRFKKIGRIYFHCIDYSERRFENYLLDKIYHHIYRFALKRADICGVVSRRMMRKLSALTNDEEKLIFIPNSPVFKEYNIDLEKRNKYSVVIMSGRIDEKTNYKTIFDILAELGKDFPRIDFKIIAKLEDDAYVSELKEYIKEKGLENKIFFLGFFPNPSDLMEILVNCGVGITSYSLDKAGYHTEYGDSLKIREYALYALPIVADSTCDTAFEAEENRCGFVADTKEDITKALKKLWENDSIYEEYSRNALEWAKTNDKKVILRNLFGRLND